MEGTPSPKDYPFARELAERMEENRQVIQVGGGEDEQVATEFRANLSFDDLGKLIEECETAVCVDSFLQHAMWFFSKPAIVLWGISDPEVFGHPEHINLLRDRKFLRPNQFDLYYKNEHRPEAFFTPPEVIEKLNMLY